MRFVRHEGATERRRRPARQDPDRHVLAHERQVPVGSDVRIVRADPMITKPMTDLRGTVMKSKKILYMLKMLLLGIVVGCGYHPQPPPVAVSDDPVEASAMAYLRSKGVRFQRAVKESPTAPAKRSWWASLNSDAQLTDADYQKFRAINLENLYISSNMITDEGLAALAQLDCLTYLYLAHLCRVTDAGVDQLVNLGTLQELNICGVAITDHALTRFDRLRQLQRLTLTEVPITGAGVKAFGRLKQLQQLNLTKTRFSDAGCAELVSMPALTHLTLEETAVTDAGCAALAQMPVLRGIRLRDTAVGNEGLRLLLASKSLQGFSLSGTRIDDDGLRHLGAFARLKSVSLNRTRITDRGLRHLHGCKGLKEICIVPDGVRVTEDGLRELKQALPELLLRRIAM